VERAGSALGPLIKDLGLEDSLRLYRIKQSWQETLGQPLSLHTAPSGLKGGLLYVSADTPAWLQQTGYYRAQVLEKLARFGVTDIRLKLGRVDSPATRKTPEERPRIEPDPELLDELVSSIEDEDVKEAVRRAVQKALSRPERKPR
jgi:predicted nucleic acid-binding Zn ribbon protein